MADKIKRLKFTYMDYIDVDINLKRKRTILNGKSAIGKSYLYEVLNQYSQEEKRDDILCLNVDNVDMKNIEHTIEKIKKMKDGIIIIDQADNILSNKKLYKCVMDDYENYYILMSRQYFERYSELARPDISNNSMGIQYKLNVI